MPKNSNKKEVIGMCGINDRTKTWKLFILKITLGIIFSVFLISKIAYAGDITAESGIAEIEKNNEVFLNLKNTEAGGRQYALVSAGSAGGIGVGKFSVYDKTADNNRLTIDTSGNVGIGTTSPSEKLHVIGNVLASGTICDMSGCIGAGGGGSGGWSDDGANVRLTTSTDKVGIGTSMPGSELEISGQLKVTSSINDKIVLAGNQAGPHTIYLDNSKGLRIWDSVNNELMRVTNTGNVGIGTATPATVFHVYHPTWATNRVQTSAHIGTFSADNLIGGVVLLTDSASPLILGTSNTERVRILAGGNVGIGTTGPVAKLDIGGSTGGFTQADGVAISKSSSGAPVYALLLQNKATEAANNAAYLNFGGPSNWMARVEGGFQDGSGNGYLALWTATGGAITERMRIKNDGNVGIGTTNPGEKLEISGNVRLSGASPTYRITNVAMPIADSDVATKEYVDAAAGGGGTIALYGFGAAPACPVGWTEIVGQTSAGTFAPVTSITVASPDSHTGNPMATGGVATTYTYYYRICQVV